LRPSLQNGPRNLRTRHPPALLLHANHERSSAQLCVNRSFVFLAAWTPLPPYSPFQCFFHDTHFDQLLTELHAWQGLQYSTNYLAASVLFKVPETCHFSESSLVSAYTPCLSFALSTFSFVDWYPHCNTVGKTTILAQLFAWWCL